MDENEIRALFIRAADAVAPLIDKLYEKALKAYQSVFDTTVGKFDLPFRVQNAQRLLR